MAGEPALPEVLLLTQVLADPATEIEELVLDLPQHLVEPAMPLPFVEPLGVEDPHQADDGVQLVDGAVGDDARRVLGDPLAADQGGLALVAGASVDARDADRHGASSLVWSTVFYLNAEGRSGMIDG